MFKNDLLRTFIYVIISFSILNIYLRKIISNNLLIISFLILALIDLIPFNNNYVNSDNFVKAKYVEVPFTANDADNEILKDSSKFRVFDYKGFNNTDAS